jgi:O-antigen/teichoic acid export membrane protein
MSVNLIAQPPQPVSRDDEAIVALPGVAEISDQHTQDAQPLQGRLRRGAAWVILARVAGIGVTMLVNIVLARWLSPDEFGDFLLLCNIMSLASVLAMMGLNVALVRFISESLGQGDVARARECLRLVLALAVVTTTSVAGLAALAMSYLGTTILGLPDVPRLVPMAVTGLVLLTVLQLMAEACRGLHELRLASLFSGGQSGGLLSNLLLLMLLAGAIVFGKPSIFLAVVLNLVAMAISVPVAILGLSYARRDRLAIQTSHRSGSALSVGQLMAFSLPLLFIQLLTFVTTQSDLWIAGIFCPHDQLALYGAARRLVLLITIPLQMAILTIVSSIAELHGQQRHGEIERVLRRAMSLAAAPSIIAILVLIAFGGPVLELLFGPFFRQAALPLSILGVGQLFLVCAGGSGCALEMTGHQLGSLLVNLMAAVGLVTIGTWSARHFGIVGLAVASSSVITAQSLCMWLLAKKLVGVWTHPMLRPWRSFEMSAAE